MFYESVLCWVIKDLTVTFGSTTNICCSATLNMIIQDIIRLRIAGEYFIINITSCLLTLDAKVMQGFGACSNAMHCTQLQMTGFCL